MKISIIIPIYNSQDTIKRCIDSIINQTYKNIEILLIDNNSTDTSNIIINNYCKKDKRIIYFKEEKQGVSYARNLGIKKSKGKYIMFVDADDYLEKDAIENMINLLNIKKCDLIRAFYNTEINTYDKRPKYKLNKLYNKKEIQNYIIPNIINQNIGSYIWLLLIKKELLKGIKFNEKLFIHQDIYFYLELLNKINNIYFSNIKIYNYCFSKNSSKTCKYYNRNIYNIIDLYKELLNIYPKEKEISNLCFKMIIPYFRKMYFYNKNQFNKTYMNIKNNNDFKKISKNIQISKIKINYLIEYLLLFKVSKKLYIIYIKIISLFRKYN